MKNRFYYYAGSLAPLIAVTSPGIGFHEDVCTATSPSGIVILEPSVETQNEMVRCRIEVYDRLMDALPAFGSGAGTSTGRVWYEAATTQLSKMSDVQRGSTDVSEVRVTADIAEVVAEIRGTLSLQIKELAEILGVERPTVYSWLRGEAKPQRSNRIRLSRVLQIALAWKRESASPIGNAIREALDDAGCSVLDDLRSESFDTGLIVAKLHSIKQKADAESSRSKSILDLARELGFDKSKVRQQHDVLDVASGRRMHEE